MRVDSRSDDLAGRRDRQGFDTVGLPRRPLKCARCSFSTVDVACYRRHEGAHDHEAARRYQRVRDLHALTLFKSACNKPDPDVTTRCPSEFVARDPPGTSCLYSSSDLLTHGMPRKISYVCLVNENASRRTNSSFAVNLQLAASSSQTVTV